MTPFAAPGNINELNQERTATWNAELSGMFKASITSALAEAPGVGRAWLYNPITNGDPPATATRDIKWIAFPKIVRTESATDRAAWRRADENRNEQSEYCEWETLKDPAQNNKVVRVTFSSETPDYYRFLAENAKDHLLALYRRHVSPNVQLPDLFIGGLYDTRNRWNWPQALDSHGILMHMAQGNNALQAAVGLAAIATWPRHDGDGPIVDESRLIGCAEFGEAGRHSDPHIGAQVNELVRAGNDVSFADPAGLYIDSIDTADWETPDGSQAVDWIRVVRPDVDRRSGVAPTDFALRVIVEAPADSDFVLGDVKIGGTEIRFGGQIADKILIRLRGVARPAPSAAPSLTCREDDQPLTGVLEEAAPAFPGFPATRRAQVANLRSPE